MAEADKFERRAAAGGSLFECIVAVCSNASGVSDGVPEFE